MFVISLTFDFSEVKIALQKWKLLLLALGLVFGPMAIISLALGRLFFTDFDLILGQVLVGVLPTDVSTPLLVYLAKGSTALAAMMNTINTALTPLILPFLLLLLTGIEFEIPASILILELFLIIVIPMLAGVSLRTKFTEKVIEYEPLYSFISSNLYLLLLFTVVTDSATFIMDYKLYALGILGVQLLLNLIGYGLALLFKPVINERKDHIALLFTASTKEFSIAVAVAYTAGLAEIVVIPAVCYAIVQMLTSPDVDFASGN
ncbi:bile acid:sodium symporter [Fuchsiella alkaliacetigena]|nr:bile acid:sodium symporter [Fuchsiella alkaliacetigena]